MATITTLQEYIGTLVSSISDARMMSDARSALLAEEYAKHPVLKHFPIPRMRIDDVEMEISLALDDIKDDVRTTAEPIDNTKVNSLVYKEIVTGLGLKSLPLAASRTLKSLIAQKTKSLESDINIVSSTAPIQDFVSQIATEGISISRSAGVRGLTATTETLQARIERAIKPAINLTEVKSRNLMVIAESKELSERQPDTFIKVKMKIAETNLEWIKVTDSEGNEIDTLLPE